MQSSSNNPSDGNSSAPSQSAKELQMGLQALRESLEWLSESLEEDSDRAAQLAQSLLHLESVDRNAAALEEYAFPCELHASGHMLSDLILEATERMPEEWAARLLLDLDGAEAPVWIDGPVFVNRLEDILNGALESQTGTVFVHAHPGDGYFHLTLVWTGSETANNRFQATVPFQLALRDLERMGVHNSNPQIQGPQDCLVLRLIRTTGNGTSGNGTTDDVDVQ